MTQGFDFESLDEMLTEVLKGCNNVVLGVAELAISALIKYAEIKGGKTKINFDDFLNKLGEILKFKPQKDLLETYIERRTRRELL